ncbi:unnamed protein product [Closterium sp. NIES-65]|nr:unnamed protein product [Closterium sp. NIES-65]
MTRALTSLPDAHARCVSLQFLVRKKRAALVTVGHRIKDELMLVGFISIVLALIDPLIVQWCITIPRSTIFIPCKPPSSSSASAPPASKSAPPASESAPAGNTAHLGLSDGRQLLSGRRGFDDGFHHGGYHHSGYHEMSRRVLSSSENTCPSGQEPFMSPSGVHQLHLFIFFLALGHILYSCITIIIAHRRVMRWKSWEAEALKKSLEMETVPVSGQLALALQDSAFQHRHGTSLTSLDASSPLILVPPLLPPCTHSSQLTLAMQNSAFQHRQGSWHPTAYVHMTKETPPSPVLDKTEGGRGGGGKKVGGASAAASYGGGGGGGGGGNSCPSPASAAAATAAVYGSVTRSTSSVFAAASAAGPAESVSASVESAAAAAAGAQKEGLIKKREVHFTPSTKGASRSNRDGSSCGDCEGGVSSEGYGGEDEESEGEGSEGNESEGDEGAFELDEYDEVVAWADGMLSRSPSLLLPHHPTPKNHDTADTGINLINQTLNPILDCSPARTRKQ